MLDAALAWAAAGWRVFPCSPQTKRPLLKKQGGQDGTGWKAQATCDAATLRGWWSKWPAALIGVPMGANGPDVATLGEHLVIDFDPRVDADTGEVFTLARLKAETETQLGCALPDSVVSLTQSDGVHLWLRLPPGVSIGNKGSLPDHVDVRGQGGYVIAPPSVMASGKRYRWHKAPTLFGGDMNFATAPAALIDALTTPTPAPAPPAAPTSGASSRAQPSGDAILDAQARAVRAYADKAFKAELERVEQAGDGARNDTLNAAALKLGHLVAAGALVESLVVAALEHAASRWPNLPKSKGTIQSGLQAGKRTPTDLTAVREQAAERERQWQARKRHTKAQRPEPPFPDHPGPGPQHGQPSGAGGLVGAGADSPGAPEMGSRGASAADLDLVCARHALTDLGNAKRFYDRFGADFLWCKEFEWLAWDGRRWKIEGKWDHSTLLLDACIRTVEAIQDESKALVASREGPRPPRHSDEPGVTRWGQDLLLESTDTKEVWLSDAVRRWAKASQSAGKIGAFAPLARKWLRVDRARLDADPFALTCLNGTLHIATGQALQAARREGKPYVTLRPHRREDLITRLASAAYDPASARPGYEAFLARVQPRPHMRRFLAQWAGLMLTGATGLRAFVWHYGPKGSNGKSTWSSALQAVLGDYALQIKIETILNQGRNRRGGEPSPDLAELPGVRAVFCSEPEQGAVISEALIKDLTGGDLITCRTLFGPMFRFEMLAKISVNGNHEPKIQSTDDAIWGRVKIVPWLESLEGDPEKKDKEHFDALWGQEASGVLNWMLDGLCDYLDSGLVFPAEVVEATADHRQDSDPVGRFVSYCIDRVPAPYKARVQAQTLHALYLAWAKANGVHSDRPVSQKWLNQRLEGKGFEQVKASVMFWDGVHLRFSPSDFIDERGDVRLYDEPPAPRPWQPPAGMGG